VKRGGEESLSVSDRVLSQLLHELDGIEPLRNVTVLAATNRPDIIDKALMRPGRIDRILYVSPPDLETRREIFRIQLAKTPHEEMVTAEELARRTEGYSGSEAVAVCREAALYAMMEDPNIDKVYWSHYAFALDSVKPRLTQELLDFFTSYRESSQVQSI